MNSSRPPRPGHVDARHDPVLVAVAPDGSEAAVRQAAALAARLEHPIRVLHVVELIPGADLAPPGTQVLHDALVLARGLLGRSATVTSELAHGDVIGRIVASAQTASYVVLRQAVQPDARGRGAEVGPEVAARVDIPVVCVPRLWAAHGDLGAVSVAIKDPVTCGPLLQMAAVVAGRRGVPLRVVHVGSPEQHVVSRRLIEEQLSRWDDRPTATQAEVVLASGDPLSRLRAASDASGLLVVGGRHRRHPGGSTTGSVAQALARRAGCPVLLADAQHPMSSAEQRFQTERA